MRHALDGADLRWEYLWIELELILECKLTFRVRVRNSTTSVVVTKRFLIIGVLEIKMRLLDRIGFNVLWALLIVISYLKKGLITK